QPHAIALNIVRASLRKSLRAKVPAHQRPSMGGQYFFTFTFGKFLFIN
ncbi:unnamed protein product, partial [marine sediment metagenome]